MELGRQAKCGSVKEDALLGHKVRLLYPDIARELSRKPIMTDVSLIPQIIQTHYQAIDDLFTPKLIFMAALLKIYDPDVMDGWKRNLLKGMRDPLADYFDTSPTAISNNIKSINNYYTIYKKFKDKVDSLSIEIVEFYGKMER